MRKKQLKIKIAKHTGFCFGVKRAVGIAEDFLKKNKSAYSIGPIIHNPVVVKELSHKGLKVIDDIKKARGANIVIRSHGLPPYLRKRALKASVGMVDATCPFVKRSHDIVTLLNRENYQIIIIGEKSHPEIKALSEVAGEPAQVVTNQADLKNLRLKNKKVAVLAQTTLSHDGFLNIAASIFSKGCFEYRIFDTICNDVVRRQAEAKELARKVDLILVVGGKISANTNYLARICRDIGTRTYHIETEKELKSSWLKGLDSVGIISGASTPRKVVNRVVSKLKKRRA